MLPSSPWRPFSTGTPRSCHDVLWNLVDNAVKHSPEGGRIELRARADGDGIALSVADDGPGLPEADLLRVFERFYRVDRSRARDPGGTGLGLAIVKHLVELHGGRVRAANQPGRGAVFTVWLPRAQPAAVTPRPVHSPDPDRRERARTAPRGRGARGFRAHRPAAPTAIPVSRPATARSGTG